MILLRALGPVLLLVFAGCSPGDRDAQPRNVRPAFGEGAFDVIPRFPRSNPVGKPTEVDDHMAQSFEAQRTTPEQVLRFYAERLDAWRNVVPVHRKDKTWLGEWQRDDRRLRVTAAPAPKLEGGGDDEAGVQYSLELRVDG